MDDGRNRRGRKYQSRFARALIPALLLGSALMVASAPAQAMTGGASPYPSGGATESALVEEAFDFTAMRSAGATWYGPGLYGRHTACGQTLRPMTIGVAHKTLPCGTAVKFIYRGRSIVARVIDRGPYSVGNAWDLTNGARLALGFEGANQVRYAIGHPLAE
jgi:rare lipoprotein A (peptidoglycan hydrolase)